MSENHIKHIGIYFFDGADGDDTKSILESIIEAASKVTHIHGVAGDEWIEIEVIDADGNVVESSVPAALLTLAGAHVAWSRRFMPHLLMDPR